MQESPSVTLPTIVIANEEVKVKCPQVLESGAATIKDTARNKKSAVNSTKPIIQGKREPSPNPSQFNPETGEYDLPIENTSIVSISQQNVDYEIGTIGDKS